jgi:predicted ribosomally synthesized peptide with nif11-like leader
MSEESAKAFFELLKSDEGIAKEMTDAKSDDQVWAVVKSAGDFDFTKKELHEAFVAQSGQELSEEDLDKVAGGSDWPWDMPGV